MLQPIRQDHEILCQNCGCVLAEIPDSQANVFGVDSNTIKTTQPSLINSVILGTALDKNVNRKLQRTYAQYSEEQGLRFLDDMIKEFDLPTSLAIDTYRILKKKNKPLTEKNVTRQLVVILQKDDNYLFINKTKKLITKYRLFLK